MRAAVKSEVWKLGDMVTTRYGQGEAVEIDVVGGHGAFAEVVWRMEDDERSPKCEGRAHLISAAPELLAALRDIVEGSPLDQFNRNDDGLQDNGGGYGFQKRIDAALAAIAKATGSTP